MVLSSLYAFKDTVATAGDTEELTIDAGTDFVSDVLDLRAADINDGGGNLFLNLHCIATANLGANVDITFLFEESAAGSTFQTFASKIVNTSVSAAEHALLALGQVVKIPLKTDLMRYLRISSSSDSITGTATFKAFISTS